jgi:hypothetical protein
VVGEADNALLVYLVASSRILPDPLAAVLRGGSSTGKSTILERVLRLFPDDVKVEAMRLTDASLFNMGRDYLKHKILVCGERRHATDDAAKDATALVRQMLSEKKIDRLVSVPDGSGGWTAERQVSEGPVAYLESTTARSIFAEDLNRMLQLHADDSKEQNRAVMVAIGGRYDPGAREEADVEAVVARHHEFQDSLRPCRVTIPCARRLAELMPAGKPECRRVIRQVLTVVEALALLHQHRREEQDGALLATPDDYALARRLLLPSVHAAVGAGKDYKNAERLRKKITGPEFTAKEVKKALGYKSEMGPSHLLNALVKAGLLVRLTEKQGRIGATYGWANGAQSSLVLPTAEELFA